MDFLKERVVPSVLLNRSFSGWTVIACRQDGPSAVLDAATIQTFVDAKNARHRLERGVLITSGRFDPSAIRLAWQHDLALISGGDLSVTLGLGLVG